MLLFVELDIVGGEQARLAVEVSEPPILVREFLRMLACNLISWKRRDSQLR